jgi:hypothetical protein
MILLVSSWNLGWLLNDEMEIILEASVRGLLQIYSWLCLEYWRHDDKSRQEVGAEIQAEHPQIYRFTNLLGVSASYTEVVFLSVNVRVSLPLV